MPEPLKVDMDLIGVFLEQHRNVFAGTEHLRTWTPRDLRCHIEQLRRAQDELIKALSDA